MKIQINKEQHLIVLCAKKLFESDDGKILFKHLDLYFSNDVFEPDNIHATLVNIGRRDVIRYIKNLVNMDYELIT